MNSILKIFLISTLIILAILGVSMMFKSSHNPQKWTPQNELNSAATKASLDEVHKILEDHKRLDLNMALVKAAESDASKKNIEVIKFLVESGANVNGKGRTRGLPLFWAAYQGNVFAVEYLLNKQADPNIISTQGFPVIGITGNIQIVRLLLKAGANVNAKNSVGDTALHTAARTRNKELIAFLLENGADKNIKNKKGETPRTQVENIIKTDIPKYNISTEEKAKEIKEYEKIIQLLQ